MSYLTAFKLAGSHATYDQLTGLPVDYACACVHTQVFITAPNPASGPIPEDVAGTFDGPYFEWFSTDKAKVVRL